MSRTRLAVSLLSLVNTALLLVWVWDPVATCDAMAHGVSRHPCTLGDRAWWTAAVLSFGLLPNIVGMFLEEADHDR